MVIGMSNLGVTINKLKYAREYESVKKDWRGIRASLLDKMDKSSIDVLYFAIENSPVNLKFKFIKYYSCLQEDYENLREFILNNYHYDFICKGDAMHVLDMFTEYMKNVEKIIFSEYDIDTEGECML